MSLTPPQCAARSPMRSVQRFREGFPQAPFFGGMFECETGKFVCFFCRKLLTGGGTCTSIRYRRQRRTSTGKPGNHQSNVAGVLISKHRFDRANRLPSCGALSSNQHLRFGCMDRRHGFPRIADSVAGRSDVIGGLAGFEGLLARPVQRSRYWSLSNPLPLSRSFHQASPCCASSSSTARTADSMMRS